MATTWTPIWIQIHAEPFKNMVARIDAGHAVEMQVYVDEDGVAVEASTCGIVASAPIPSKFTKGEAIASALSTLADAVQRHYVVTEKA